ncbi:TIGR03862 family flavoprotein [Herbaspirillum sp. RTI4]|uniref:TIGR03862 family flavoprotein n=1 Tax=Herbaspirillum sp. RTI4 TaxID=3048640 RepID=UPI002AB36764|nr:TIGR03862 family flavoprotein [Herbaspirillum sp. RTI4]MDY7576955.1 TIGR03862 family flavoprotein [Herbaspirillum sp. RTI4]MEA9982143.1 TIGR03862 family flavoprotein [Herbaspirillum sp. RTI4]
MSELSPIPSVAIIGGGPAGLMAAERLAAGGVQVDLYDAMPSVGRKFLLAGKGGLNITHAEAYPQFLQRYADRQTQLTPLLDAFNPDTLRAWVQELGIDSFVGSSGRVFPTDMKAAPLLRAWLHRLRAAGVRFHMRHRWLGWDAEGALRFATPDGEISIPAAATVLALGGASWPRLGSDGAWCALLQQREVSVAPLQAANCGFDVHWSEHLRSRFAGQPLKSVAAWTAADGSDRKAGEFMLSEQGVEGSLVYSLSASLRTQLHAQGRADLHLDLLPDRSLEFVTDELLRPRGARSLSSHLQSRLGLKGVKASLLRELASAEDFADPVQLAQRIKSLAIPLISARPIAEAISSAGGVSFDALDAQLMLKAIPGLFCAGEMLDWEAPTGGYLLTACLASGRAAGDGALTWLTAQSADQRQGEPA